MVDNKVLWYYERQNLGLAIGKSKVAAETARREQLARLNVCFGYDNTILSVGKDVA